MISKQYYDVFGFLLDHSGCVDNVVCCSVLANRWPKMKYETTKSFYRTQVQSIAPYEDCYSSLVSAVVLRRAMLESSIALLAEQWVEILNLKFGQYFKVEMWPRF